MAMGTGHRHAWEMGRLQRLDIDAGTMDTTTRHHPNGNGNGGPPPAAVAVHATTANAARRTRWTAGLALFVLCGVGRWMLPAPRKEDYTDGDDPSWASRGDAAGGWGTRHHHPIAVGDRGDGGGAGGGGAGDRTNDAGDDGSSPRDADDSDADDDDSSDDDSALAARTSDLLAALSPLVSLPSRLPNRPEYERYRSAADGSGRTEEDVAADVLRDVRTAHGRAFDFVVRRDGLSVGIDDPSLVQRFVLALLFYATGGKDSQEDEVEDDDGATGGSVGASAGWNVGTAHFLSESHECRWNEKKDVDDGFWGMLSFGGNEGRRVGVTKCNADMEVTAIRLADLHLVGFVPEEIKWLSSLESLDVQNNHLAGPIPEAIGELDALTYLSLDGNNFSGTIPDVFDDLRHLERAYLNFNEFGGAMPRSLCALREEGGALTDLWSDCGGYPIACTCCTVCCDTISECYEMESQREEGGGGKDG